MQISRCIIIDTGIISDSNSSISKQWKPKSNLYNTKAIYIYYAVSL